MGEPAATAALLAALGILLVLAGLASPISSRLGVPVLVVFLGLGMLAGSEGIGGIPFDDYALAFRLGTVALVFILFDGALNTAPEVVRRAALPAGLLATVSVVLTAALVALAGWMLGLPGHVALLVGSVVSSTDAAATFMVLRGSGVRLHRSTAATLELASGLNDPLAILLTLVATEIALGHAIGARDVTLLLVRQFGVGGIVGVTAGFAARSLLRNVRLPAGGLYPVLTVAVAFLSFGIAALLDGSGFVAVYATGLVLAAGPLPYGAGVRRVHDALAWLAQIMMFSLLGLLVFPSRLAQDAGIGLAIAAFLAFVARPLAAAAVLVPLRLPVRELLFISWVGLRGAVPIILAVFPLMAGLPDAQLFFNLAFFIVLVSLLVQGTSLPWMAKLLKVTVPPNPAPISRSALEVHITSEWELFVYRLGAEKWCIGAALRELKMPEGTRIAALFRGEQLLHPSGSTVLEANDMLGVIGHEHDLPALGKLFSQPPQRGLDLRFFGDFVLEGDAELGAVAALYGLKLDGLDAKMSLAQFIRQKVGGAPVVGDQIEWHSTLWTVALMEGNKILKVGVKFPEGTRPGPGLFL